MLKYTHVGTMVFAKSQYTDNITDMVIVDTAVGPILVSTADLGLSVFYKLSNADSAATEVMRKDPPKFGTYFSAPEMEVIQRDGTDLIVYTGMEGSVNVGLQVLSYGRAGNFIDLFRATQVRNDVVSAKSFDIDGQGYFMVSRDGRPSVTLYRMDDSARLNVVGELAQLQGLATDAEIVDMDVATVRSGTFGFAASSQGNMLAVFSISDSGLKLTGKIDASNKIGISAPRDVATLATENGDFLIVTGGQSDSITVMRIYSHGGLALADHVVDSGSTRFQAVTAMATVVKDGRAFVFVGGGDDGISVMTLDGQGRLILLATIEDTDALALANVSAIEARIMGAKIALFVTSATEVGITQFSFDPGTIGISRVGTGRRVGGAHDDVLVGTGSSSSLSGGDGDDILVAREGVVYMRGGTGSDTFIPGHGAKLAVIYDYNPRYDQIDLSELGFVRSIAQLRIIPTSSGAMLIAGSVKIEIRTENGAMLRPSDFSEKMFKLAHYANNIDFADLVDKVRPDPGTPSVAPTPSSGSGGYITPSTLPRPTSTADRQYGGNGNDKLTARSAGSYLNGRGGHDALRGSNKQDLLYGDLGNDKIYGGGGTDYINGGQGHDTIYAQDGHDSVDAGTGYNVIYGGAGDDRLRGNAHRDIINGDDGDDIIWGGAGNDVLNGGGDSDLIYGGGGIDVISGGAGHDRLYGQASGGRVSGSSGNDLISVVGGGNIVIADSGNDTVTGGSGSDRIFLGSGHDRASGLSGSDTIEGGYGNDTIYGGTGNDRLLGDGGNDRLYGGDGHEIAIRGGNGDDRLYGDSGNDMMGGDGGNDFMDGGTGNDTMRAGVGRDRMIGGDGDDYVFGDADRDTITAGNGSDRLYGGSGNDYLDGGAGGDRLFGDDGNDVLVDGSGSDTLLGGVGLDTLIAGDGYDRLTGGTGIDVFVFKHPSRSHYGELDTIYDFASDRDVVDLTALPGTLVWLGSGGFTDTGYAEVRWASIQGGRQLQVDINGDGRSDLRISVYGDAVTPFDLLF